MKTLRLHSRRWLGNRSATTGGAVGGSVGDKQRALVVPMTATVNVVVTRDIVEVSAVRHHLWRVVVKVCRIVEIPAMSAITTMPILWTV